MQQVLGPMLHHNAEFNETQMGRFSAILLKGRETNKGTNRQTNHTKNNVLGGGN